MADDYRTAAILNPSALIFVAKGNRTISEVCNKKFLRKQGDAEKP